MKASYKVWTTFSLKLGQFATDHPELLEPLGHDIKTFNQRALMYHLQWTQIYLVGKGKPTQALSAALMEVNTFELSESVETFSEKLHYLECMMQTQQDDPEGF